MFVDGNLSSHALGAVCRAARAGDGARGRRIVFEPVSLVKSEAPIRAHGLPLLDIVTPNEAELVHMVTTLREQKGSAVHALVPRLRVVPRAAWEVGSGGGGWGVNRAPQNWGEGGLTKRSCLLSNAKGHLTHSSNGPVAKGTKGRVRLWTSFPLILVICMCCVLCCLPINPQHTRDSSHVTIRGVGGGHVPVLCDVTRRYRVPRGTVCCPVPATR